MVNERVVMTGGSGFVTCIGTVPTWGIVPNFLSTEESRYDTVAGEINGLERWETPFLNVSGGGQLSAAQRYGSLAPKATPLSSRLVRLILNLIAIVGIHGVEAPVAGGDRVFLESSYWSCGFEVPSPVGMHPVCNGSGGRLTGRAVLQGRNPLDTCLLLLLSSAL